LPFRPLTRHEAGPISEPTFVLEHRKLKINTLASARFSKAHPTDEFCVEQSDQTEFRNSSLHIVVKCGETCCSSCTLLQDNELNTSCHLPFRPLTRHEAGPISEPTFVLEHRKSMVNTLASARFSRAHPVDKFCVKQSDQTESRSSSLHIIVKANTHARGLHMGCTVSATKL